MHSVKHLFHHRHEHFIPLSDGFLISRSTGLEGDIVPFGFTINDFVK